MALHIYTLLKSLVPLWELLRVLNLSSEIEKFEGTESKNDFSVGICASFLLHTVPYYCLVESLSGLLAFACVHYIVNKAFSDLYLHNPIHWEPQLLPKTYTNVMLGIFLG